MGLKIVARRDGKLIRLFRVMWKTGTVGDGEGYSSCLSVGLYPRLLCYRRESFGWRAWLFGLRLHYDRSYGGIHT